MSPSYSVSEAAGSFKTYASYLRAFATIAHGSNLSGRPTLLHDVRARVFSSGLLPSSRCTAADLRQSEASLKNAWGTELLLAMGKRFIDSDELIGLSNNWSVVQAYYVFYHATQAITVAQGT